MDIKEFICNSFDVLVVCVCVRKDEFSHPNEHRCTLYIVLIFNHVQMRNIFYIKAYTH